MEGLYSYWETSVLEFLCWTNGILSTPVAKVRNTFSVAKVLVGKNLEHKGLFILQVLWNKKSLI